jgi:hypothetical protein
VPLRVRRAWLWVHTFLSMPCSSKDPSKRWLSLQKSSFCYLNRFRERHWGRLRSWLLDHVACVLLYRSIVCIFLSVLVSPCYAVDRSLVDTVDVNGVGGRYELTRTKLAVGRKSCALNSAIGQLIMRFHR